MLSRGLWRTSTDDLFDSEPEARLYLLIPMLILQVVGYAGWAAMQQAELSYWGPVIVRCSWILAAEDAR